MKITTELSEAYKDLIAKIYDKRDCYGEEELTLFTPCIGKQYDQSLMVIGRAVNGWRVYIDKTDHEYINTSLAQVKNNFGKDDLQWVIDCWGDSESNYNSKKSAFWRVSKRLSSELIENNDSVINKIAWSNLYKIAKDEGGNPSGRLMDVQLEECKKILKLEIKLLKPKIAVFFTSLNWAKWFLDDPDFKKIDIKANGSFVEYAAKFEGSLLIIAQHPQGKPEKTHSDEIISVINRILRK